MEREMIEDAMVMIRERATKGELKKAIAASWRVSKTKSIEIIEAAVRELYDSDRPDVEYWISQLDAAATPMQRRFARRKITELRPLEAK